MEINNLHDYCWDKLKEQAKLDYGYTDENCYFWCDEYRDDNDNYSMILNCKPKNEVTKISIIIYNNDNK